MRTRILLRAMVLLASLSAAFPTLASTADWKSLNPVGAWSQPANWHGGGIPGFGDTARIGGVIVGTENHKVVLDQPGFVDALLINDGMKLSNLDRDFQDQVVSPLTADTRVSIAGENSVGSKTYHSSLYLHRSPATFDLNTHIMNIKEGGRFEMFESAIANIHNAMVIHSPESGESEGRLSGNGVVNLTGEGDGFTYDGSSLRNNGTIDPRGSLTLNQLGNGLYDFGSQAGRLEVGGTDLSDTQPDHLTITGTGLTNAFGGTIELRNGRRLTMNLSDGWTAGVNSKLFFGIDALAEGAAVVAGDHATLEGFVGLQLGNELFPAIARFEADTTINPTANFQLLGDAQGQFANTTINGGQFGLASAATLTFDGDTVVNGGHFSTISDKISDGNVLLQGDTTYSGQVTFAGVARQAGDATVASPTLINADRFDMSQAANNTWDIHSSLTVNAQNINLADGNLFTATMDVSGIVGSLTINLDDPHAKWTLAGELNLANQFSLPVKRLAGSGVLIGNRLNADGSGIRVDTDTTFAATSTNTFATSATSLLMTAQTRVHGGAEFVGEGLLQNSTTGRMTLDDGVSTDNVGLHNAGLLGIDDEVGIATIGRFENHPTGTLAIDLAGHQLGDEFDHLLVVGAAKLDGTLTIDLVVDELGDPLFRAEVGDEFKILTSLSGVLGEFTYVPPTVAGGQAYNWEALYDPHDVTIRLASVGAVPEPASLALAACGLLGIVLFRR